MSPNHGSRSPVVWSYARSVASSPSAVSPSMTTTCGPSSIRETSPARNRHEDSVAESSALTITEPDRSWFCTHWKRPPKNTRPSRAAIALSWTESRRSASQSSTRPVARSSAAAPRRGVSNEPAMNMRSPEIDRLSTCPPMPPAGPQSSTSPVRASSFAKLRLTFPPIMPNEPPTYSTSPRRSISITRPEACARKTGSIVPSARRWTKFDAALPEHAVELAADVEPALAVGLQRADAEVRDLVLVVDAFARRRRW